MPGLRSLPYWTQVKDGNAANIVAYGDPSVSAVVQHLDAHWESILKEYNDASSTLASDYQTDTEHHILHEGKWDWHSYMTKGVVVNDQKATFLEKFPVTASILHELRRSNQLFEGTPFGYAFFSTLHSHSKIKAHTAPMNFRLRIHLPLSVPLSASDGSQRPACGIRVGNAVREWTTGKSLVLDDSYEHEVWNDTAERRVLLLVDVWHPDVTLQERQEITSMFQDAKEKGWLS
jgi:Aspartyl/Asparaginyl beta-hydroxylase